MELVIDRKPRHWWLFLLRGVIFVLLGVYMIFAPTSGFAAMGFLLGLAILLGGVFQLYRTVRDPDEHSRLWHLIGGIVELVIGIVLIGHIGTSEAILRIIVGLWFIVSGVSVFNLSRTGTKNLMLTIGGVLIVLLGLFIIFDSTFGATTIVLVTAIAFIITGIFNIMLGFRLKR